MPGEVVARAAQQYATALRVVRTFESQPFDQIVESTINLLESCLCILAERAFASHLVRALVAEKGVAALGTLTGMHVYCQDGEADPALKHVDKGRCVAHRCGVEPLDL